MNKKIIFFDIDGTLLASEKGITKPTNKTVRTLNQLKNSGALLFITTGRPYCLINQEIRNLNFDGYITSNGMCTIINNKVIIGKTITDKSIDLLIELSNKYSFGYHLETPELIYVSSNNKKCIESYFIKYDLPLSLRRTNRKQFSNGFNKMAVYLRKDSDINILMKKFQELKFYKIEDCIYEASFSYVSKGSAIKELIKEAEFINYESFAFGDGVNDIEMMKLVDNPVAMGNCHPSLLKYTKYQTSCVMEEGIYKFWKNYKEVS